MLFTQQQITCGSHSWTTMNVRAFINVSNIKLTCLRSSVLLVGVDDISRYLEGKSCLHIEGGRKGHLWPHFTHAKRIWKPFYERWS